jgi:hypothetical protein
MIRATRLSSAGSGDLRAGLGQFDTSRAFPMLLPSLRTVRFSRFGRFQFGFRKCGFSREKGQKFGLFGLVRFLLGRRKPNLRGAFPAERPAPNRRFGSHQLGSARVGSHWLGYSGGPVCSGKGPKGRKGRKGWARCQAKRPPSRYASARLFTLCYGGVRGEPVRIPVGAPDSEPANWLRSAQVSSGWLALARISCPPRHTVTRFTTGNRHFTCASDRVETHFHPNT